MAKSLRSKHKRKMRAVKRVRYGAKELVKLKETVAILNPTTTGGDGLDMSQFSDTVIGKLFSMSMLLSTDNQHVIDTNDIMRKFNFIHILTFSGKLQGCC